MYVNTRVSIHTCIYVSNIHTYIQSNVVQKKNASRKRAALRAGSVVGWKKEGGTGLGYTVVGNATINITYRHGSL